MLYWNIIGSKYFHQSKLIRRSMLHKRLKCLSLYLELFDGIEIMPSVFPSLKFLVDLNWIILWLSQFFNSSTFASFEKLGVWLSIQTSKLNWLLGEEIFTVFSHPSKGAWSFLGLLYLVSIWNPYTWVYFWIHQLCWFGTDA